MNKLFTALIATAALYHTTALAQSANAQSVSAQSVNAPSPLSPIYACAEKTNPMERLACFDAAVANVKAAEARSEIIALDQPRVAAVRREAFGFRIPSLPRFGLPSIGGGGGSDATARVAEEAVEEQVFAVSRVSQAGGRTRLYLENGNIWQLAEAGDFNAPSRPPYNVRIRSATLGSFILSIEGRNKGYRVRRVE